MAGRLVLLLVVLVGISSAYDTGHHNDLTRNALQLSGYNSNAQIIAGIANFFVDYFAFTPLSSETLPELNMMHFDNIFTMKNASDYWTQFTLNAKSAVEQAARGGDPLDFIMTIGGTMHTVQDFYTHSNWVDFHYRTDCNCYRTETWLHTLHEANGDPNELLRQQAAIHTYSYGECDENSRNCYPAQLPHGNTCGGINKDSYARPYWEQSYAFAFSATVEWLDNIHQWASAINPEIITLAKNYNPPTQGDLNDMNSLNDYVHTVSYAIRFFEEDGHWKGSGSGSLKRFLPAQLAFTKSNSIYKAKYQTDKIHQRWTFPNIYDGAGIDRAQVVDVSTMAAITTPYDSTEDFTPVIVRTATVRGADKTNTPSYFATVTIDGLEFVEVVYIDQPSITPHWTSIKFVNTSASPTVPIVYTLKNNKYPRSDEVVSITNTGSNSLSVTFDLASHALTGDISGTYDSVSNMFTTKNDNANVEVQLFITANRFANCSTGLPQQYCPNEAYVYAGAFNECEGETIPENAASIVHVSILALVMLALTL